MTQGMLPLDVDPGPSVVCAFGVPWIDHLTGPCPACAAESARLSAEFMADVAAGKYNPRGYTRAEWRAAGHTAETWPTGGS